MVVDDPANALLEGGRAEIHEQTKRKIHQPKVGKKLLRVHGRVRFSGFHFDQEQSLDKQVSAKGIVDDNAIGLQ